jgi:DNA-binding MarR family transcriptional regulator
MRTMSRTSLAKAVRPAPLLREHGVLKEHLGFLLNRAAARVRARFSETLERFSITPRHYGILTLLAGEDGLTQQEVGERIFCDRTTMVNLMDDLERLGLAQRVRRPGDRRAYIVCLTEKGHAVQAKAREMARQVDAEFVQGLSATESRQLRTLLLRLMAGPQRPAGESEK